MAPSSHFFSVKSVGNEASSGPVRIDIIRSVGTSAVVSRGMSSRPSGQTASVTPVRVSGVSIPAVLAPDLSSLDLDPAHQAAIDELAEAFVTEAGEPGPDLSAFATNRVRAAMSAADARYRLLYGHQAFVRLQLLASQQLDQ